MDCVKTLHQNGAYSNRYEDVEMPIGWGSDEQQGDDGSKEEAD